MHARFVCSGGKPAARPCRRRESLIRSAFCLMAAAVMTNHGSAANVGAEDSFPVDQILSAVRSQSVHRRKIDWEAVEPEIRRRLSEATNDEQRGRAVAALFEKLDDVHSVLTYNGKSYSHYHAVDDKLRPRLVELLRLQQAQIGKPTSSVLSNRIGYLCVPGMSPAEPEDVHKLAADLRRHVDALAAQGIRRWIVDLRLNGGGNLYPMLLGLAPLLGEGVAGGTVDADERIVHRWLIDRNGLHWLDQAGRQTVVAFQRSWPIDASNHPVAVILGPATRSSGQAVALAFTGRPRTATLGEPTARGYATVVNPLTFSPQLVINLAVGRMTDRTGTPSVDVALPEQTVEGADRFERLEDDAKVRAAIQRVNELDAPRESGC